MSGAEHYPDGDGWTCSCGYDFFGGSAAYSWELFRAHVATPANTLSPDG